VGYPPNQIDAKHQQRTGYQDPGHDRGEDIGKNHQHDTEDKAADYSNQDQPTACYARHKLSPPLIELL
jgi:hypothetical protein